MDDTIHEFESLVHQEQVSQHQRHYAIFLILLLDNSSFLSNSEESLILEAPFASDRRCGYVKITRHRPKPTGNPAPDRLKSAP